MQDSKQQTRATARRPRGERLLHPNQLKHATPDPERDTLLKDGGGLYARVLAGIEKRISFVWRYSHEGKKRWLPIGKYPQMTLDEARTERDDARRLLKRGIDPLAHRKRQRVEQKARECAEAAEKTVTQIFELWERRYLKKWKDEGRLARQFLQSDILRYIGSQKAKDIAREQVVDLLDKIVDRGATRKANVVLSLLKQMLDWAENRGHIPANPIANVRRKNVGGTEVERKRNLSKEEIVELGKRLPGAKLPERVELALWILLATGVRVGELTEARWNEFDLKQSIWRLPEEHTKSGNEHLVHLSNFAVEKLERLRELSPGELLFEGRKAGKFLNSKQIGKYIRDRQRTMRLKGRSKQVGVLVLPGGEWRVHDLRRTMSSRMGDLGIAPHVIEKCLNHKLEGILAVYQQQELLPERQAAFERWGEELGHLTTGRSRAGNIIALKRPRETA